MKTEIRDGDDLGMILGMKNDGKMMKNDGGLFMIG